MTNDPREAKRAAEAKDALDRLERDQQGVFQSSMSRAADHFSGKDAPEGDQIELWGRRIGRSLSLVAFVVLSWWLGHQLGYW